MIVGRRCDRRSLFGIQIVAASGRAVSSQINGEQGLMSMAALGGWWRLWIVVSAFWVVLIASATYYNWDPHPHISPLVSSYERQSERMHSAAIAATFVRLGPCDPQTVVVKLDKAQSWGPTASLADENDASGNPFTAARPGQDTWNVECFSSAKRSSDLITMGEVAVFPPLIVATLWWAIGWVVSGFRMKPSA